MVIKQQQRKFCETAEFETELFLSLKSIKNNKSGNDELTIESYEAAQDSQNNSAKHANTITGRPAEIKLIEKTVRHKRLTKN